MYCSKTTKTYDLRASDVSSGEIKTSSPGVMQDIVDNKAYVAIGVNIIEYVLSHPDMSDASKVLWLHLYTKAARYQNWTTQITVDCLAQELGIHRRSVQRSTRSLVEHGLVVREFRYYAGRQIENGLRITVPYEVGQVILKTVPNRKRPSFAPLAHKLAHRTSTKIVVRRDTGRCGPIVEKQPSEETTVTPGSGANVIPNNNNSKQAIVKQPCNVQSARSTHLNARGLVSLASLLKQRPTIITVPDSDLTNSGKHVIMRKLSCAGFEEPMIEKLLKEIIFSCMHGQTWASTPFDKRVNACLKLIRQGRWRTPKGFSH